MTNRYDNELPEILTPEEARRYCRIGRTSFYEALRAGHCPAVRIGRQWRIARSSLLEWLERGESNSQAAGASWQGHSAAWIREGGSGDVS